MIWISLYIYSGLAIKAKSILLSLASHKLSILLHDALSLTG